MLTSPTAIDTFGPEVALAMRGGGWYTMHELRLRTGLTGQIVSAVLHHMRHDGKVKAICPRYLRAQNGQGVWLWTLWGSR